MIRRIFRRLCVRFLGVPRCNWCVVQKMECDDACGWDAKERTRIYVEGERPTFHVDGGLMIYGEQKRGKR